MYLHFKFFTFHDWKWRHYHWTVECIELSQDCTLMSSSMTFFYQTLANEFQFIFPKYFFLNYGWNLYTRLHHFKIITLYCMYSCIVSRSSTSNLNLYSHLCLLLSSLEIVAAVYLLIKLYFHLEPINSLIFLESTNSITINLAIVYFNRTLIFFICTSRIIHRQL